jgi:2-keto-4-pentenoate hydratase/2-oxohepta-3-ene-1,7-dioic acid hydratase in catechol pathway
MTTERFGRVRLGDGRAVHVQREGSDGWELDGPPWLGGRRTVSKIAADSAPLVPVEPSKIVCVGRNYREHAAELGNEVPAEPLLFLKPPSSLLGPGLVLELPPPALSRQVEHEVELAVVVGRRIRRVDAATAAAAIFGFTVAGDITARDLQRSDKQWTRAKGMDGFCPVGPETVRGLDPRALTLRCWVDGELRQQGSTAQMVFTPAALLAFISQTMTLEPGDLVLTGTPAGVGPLSAGNALRMEIDGIAPLALRVAAAAQ